MLTPSLFTIPLTLPGHCQRNPSFRSRNLQRLRTLGLFLYLTYNLHLLPLTADCLSPHTLSHCSLPLTAYSLSLHTSPTSPHLIQPRNPSSLKLHFTTPAIPETPAPLPGPALSPLLGSYRPQPCLIKPLALPPRSDSRGLSHNPAIP
ncbi:hypothetical protein K491DRAFT_57127 [Lophiostoma macrostomum CBS 122681]|uniref:Uncharacterized protein n=1 Tax=Lophiostoma macrostomum CBS 122681 TaxID=1314788 RepID=A0A6A6T078_9PLEO|nr:hypothetical protein K491DRAFT_57127 [Lophiostoma macrostomum CBS 122681]